MTDSLEASAATITQEVIDQRKKELGEILDLPEDVRQRAAELYAEAQLSLEREKFLTGRRQQFESRIASAEKRHEEVDVGLKQIKMTQPVAPVETDVNELHVLLTAEQAELKTLKARKVSLDEQAAKRTLRRSEALQRLTEIDAEIDQVKNQAALGPATGEPPQLSQAKRIANLCRLRAVRVEKPTLVDELRLYDVEATLNLLQAERSLNAMQIDQLTKQVQLTTNALQTAREKVADTALANASEAAEEVPAILRPIAEVSRKMAEQNVQLTHAIQLAEAEQKRVRTRLEDMKQKFAYINVKKDSVGLTPSIGALLRNQRRILPDTRSLRISSEHHNEKMDQVQLELFDLDEMRARLIHLEEEAERELRQLPGDPSVNVTPQNIAIARGLLESRANVVKSLVKGQSNYFEVLADTSIAEVDLIRQTNEFREYIDECVLWIRSHPPMYAPLTADDWNSERDSIRRVTSELPKILPALAADAKRYPFLYMGIAMFLFILVVARPILAVRLRRIAEMVRSSAYSHFYPSLVALAINVISCLLFPVILGFVGMRLNVIAQSEPGFEVISYGLLIAAIVTLPLVYFSRIFGKNGLADAHFDWSQHTTSLMRRNVRWITGILVPLVLVGATLSLQQAATSPGLAHRVVFVVASFSVLVLIWRVLHPDRGLPKEFLKQHEGGWLERLKLIWFWGALALPVCLATLAIMGYAYTANELAWRGFCSLTIIALLWILHGLSMRLLLVHRRRLAVERARKRYAEYQRQREEEAAAAAAAEAAAAREDAADKTTQLAEQIPKTVKSEERVIANLPGVSVTSAGLVMEDDPLADLRANTEQSRRLVGSLLIGAAVIMLWMTWHNVLPALGFLERWPLWSSSREVVQTFTNESGLTETRTREEVDPITIADVFLACFVAIVGSIAARDLPGLLELAVLQRLPLEKSVRYAITTISSYVVISIGLFAACALLGLHWEQIKWMATALTFGLAFGLQEMFANFVAGIILLFERPIRVGDIVTTDDVTGIVSRIRMRATTITNFDHKDYVVPNKDFITGRLLNWTLSDHVNRITIEVGVAYGADTAKAKELMLRIAEEHPKVVSDPNPMATFEEFSDSSLKVVLRCFIAISTMPSRLSVIDELHTAIDAAFKDAGLEIAFPQQDVHLRDIPMDLLQSLTPSPNGNGSGTDSSSRPSGVFDGDRKGK